MIAWGSDPIYVSSSDKTSSQKEKLDCFILDRLSSTHNIKSNEERSHFLALGRGDLSAGNESRKPLAAAVGSSRGYRIAKVY